MTEQALLVGCLTSALAPDTEAPGLEHAGALEWRADLAGDPLGGGPDTLFGRPWIYTLRSRAEGGNGPDAPAERKARLIAAAAKARWVDIEFGRDLDPEVLAAVPPERRIVSWHGPPADLRELRQLFESMADTAAHWYKLVPAAETPRDAVEPLALLHSISRTDVIAFASGPAGSWSRVLAPRLGARVVYAQAQAEPAASGQLTLIDLHRDYGLPELPKVSKLFGIAGLPVSHSLSPRLHNAMFRNLGLDHLLVPFHVPVFGDFWLDVVESGSLEVLGMPLAGLSVTAPFKEIAMAVAGAVSPLAERLSAANSLARRDAVWEAECTDPEGVVAPLDARGVSLGGRAAAVIGAGGAGRSALWALAAQGAEVRLVNRSEPRGRRVARELGVPFEPLETFNPDDCQLVVNATPLGSESVDLPFDPESLASDAAVVDMAYRKDRPTALVRAVRESGRTAVDGREVLLYQAVPQFRLMNSAELDLALGRAVLDLPEADW